LKGIVGLQGRLSNINVCAKLCTWMDIGFRASAPNATQKNSKLFKESVQNCLNNGTLTVFAGWICFFLLVLIFCYHRILQTPEVRRE
jgi:hypothetical protein